MNLERLKVTFEVFYLRLKGWGRTGIRLVGIVLVLLGAYNMFALVLQLPSFAPYRELGFVIFQRGGYFLGDVLIMCVGAVVAWFV